MVNKITLVEEHLKFDRIFDKVFIKNAWYPKSFLKKNQVIFYTLLEVGCLEKEPFISYSKKVNTDFLTSLSKNFEDDYVLIKSADDINGTSDFHMGPKIVRYSINKNDFMKVPFKEVRRLINGISNYEGFAIVGSNGNWGYYSGEQLYIKHEEKNLVNIDIDIMDYDPNAKDYVITGKKNQFIIPHIEFDLFSVAKGYKSMFEKFIAKSFGAGIVIEKRSSEKLFSDQKFIENEIYEIVLKAR